MKNETTLQSSIQPPPQIVSNRSIETATLELLATWRAQDATTDPEVLQAAELELAEFKKAMNESRAVSGEPVLYP